MSRSLVVLVLVVVGACHSIASPQLRVIGVEGDQLRPRREVVFVQVTNPASHTMRLTKLEYTFAADGATLSSGQVALSRDVEPGAAVVVEVPLDEHPQRPLVLTGELTAELDQIVQIFQVHAQIEPHETNAR
jgi:hypothetical protein